MADLPPPTLSDSIHRRSNAVRSAAAAWAGQIVDLGGRNTLLFYKDLKIGTLDLTPGPEANAVAVESLLGGRVTRLSQLVPADLLSASARRARTIKAKSTENFEERGLQTLFLAYGMATWTHARSDATPAAPVLLASLRVTPRGGAAEDFDLEIAGDWEVNPTLLHLLRTDFNVTTASDSLLGDDDDLDLALEALRTRCEEVPAFACAERVVIGNFSYAKQPMALDIEGSIEAMIDHPVVAAIAGAEEAQRELTSFQPSIDPSLPDRTPPADEFLVLDADASQSYVVNAAVAGANLVVQGPPGTGKSQTIANLIASLAARGKTTLFVAEKRAAIEAVTNRLANAGLQNLVLDLHGGTSSRRALVAELGRALDGFGTIPAIDRSEAQVRLERSRERLCTFNEELHRPRDGDKLSVFDIQSALIGIPERARSNLTVPRHVVDSIPLSSLDPIEESVAEWVQLGGARLGTGVHPWEAAAGRVTSAHDAEAALDICKQLSTSTIPMAMQRLDRAIGECNLRRPSTIDEWERLLSLMTDVDRTLARYEPAIFEADLEGLGRDLEPATKGAIGRAAASVFNGAYRSAKRTAGALSKTPRSPAELRDDVRAAHRQTIEWKTHSLDGRPPHRPGALDESSEAFSSLTTQLAALAAYTGDAARQVGFEEARTRTSALVEDRSMLFKLPRIHELRSSLSAVGLDGVVAEISSRHLDADLARSLVRCVWLRSKLDVICLNSPTIGAFDGAAHSSTVREFRSCDSSHVESGPQRILRRVAEHAIETLNAHPEQAQLVRQQAGRKRGHLPLRDLLQQAPDVLVAVKPCWAMSPLIVSQLLPSETPLFDVVIFDEASQIPPAEAIPAILRGRQLVVAGDTKQLPPTTFFATTVETEGTDEETSLVTQDMESILDSMVALLPPPYGSKTLGWHYRSRDERLIAFSNAQPTLYDRTMTTFPGVGIDEPIEHVAVPWRPSAPGQEESAADEVRTVVELVAAHSRERPDETLGVITMGIKHADRISEAIRVERKTDRTLDDFCADHTDEPFFVKNLERVQGDERDAIIISIGYGKSTDGKMVYRFGPLLQEGGERRLNVAITRAKRRVTLVSSFGAEDLDDAKLRSEGAQMLKRYLTYAASGGKDLGSVALPHPALNPFEVDVQRCLAEAGIPLTPQLGASGYWIDFAAKHPDKPGRFVLAIEADGAAYHSSATARDRDRLRQDHLERLGWTFHRIWSTDWFNHRDREIQRAVEAWKQAVERSDSTERRAPAAGARPAAPNSPSDLPPPSPASEPVASRAARTLPRPVIYYGEPITSYSNAQLDQVVNWIRSDTLLRTDDELLDVAIAELGYRRRGSRIVQAVEAAIARTRPRASAVSSTAGPAPASGRIGTPTSSAPAARSAAPSPRIDSGWYPDPTSRFDFRYWDGNSWTSHVSRNGTATFDPL